MPVSKVKKPTVKKTVKPVKKVAVKPVVARKTAVKTAPVVKVVKGTLKIDVYDLKGKIVEKADLPKEIFGAKVNNQLIAQAVRIYLANQRRGTVSTKTRGEVQGSTAKIYRQKGTGRARHGSKRAPIFVHGGLVFGPKPRDYSLSFPKKMRRLALFSSLSAKNEKGDIKVVKGLEKIEPKTKLMAEVINKLGYAAKKRKILLVTPDSIRALDGLYRASKNLEGVSILSANMLNTYQVLNSNSIVLMKDAISSLENTFLREKN